MKGKKILKGVGKSIAGGSLLALCCIHESLKPKILGPFGGNPTEEAQDMGKYMVKDGFKELKEGFSSK